MYQLQSMLSAVQRLSETKRFFEMAFSPIDDVIVDVCHLAYVKTNENLSFEDTQTASLN